MQKGVSLIELIQHSEIIYKKATPEIKRKLVEMVIEPANLSDGTLGYDWKKPFNMLAIKGDISKWRANCSEYRTYWLQNPLKSINDFKALQVA